MKFERNIASGVFLLILIIEYFIQFFVADRFVEVFDLPFDLNVITSELIIMLPGLIGVAVWYICRLWKETHDEDYIPIDISDRLMFKRVKISTLLMTILYTWMVMPLMTLLNSISMLFVENVIVEESDAILSMPFILSAFLIAVYGPFCEEFVFRGVIYGGFRRNCRPLAAILMSGFLFGIMHLNFNQFGYAFVIGCAMALLAEATGSIWPTIFMHFIINFQSVALLFLTDKYWGDAYDSVDLGDASINGILAIEIMIIAVIAVVTTIIAGIILKWLAKNEGRNNPLEMVKKNRVYVGKTVFNPILIIAIVMAVAIMVLSVL